MIWENIIVLLQLYVKIIGRVSEKKKIYAKSKSKVKVPDISGWSEKWKILMKELLG